MKEVYLSGEHDYGLLVVWEFQLRAGMEGRFAEMYGSGGDWACLFRTGEGFLRTELVADLKDSRRYLTLDFWVSRQAYGRFRAENAARYKAIDMRCEALTESETELGQFEPG